MIGNKIAHDITRISKISPQNNSKTNQKQIFKERYISQEQRQKIIDDLRLVLYIIMEYQKIKVIHKMNHLNLVQNI